MLFRYSKYLILFTIFITSSLNGQNNERAYLPYLVNDKYKVSDLDGKIIIDTEFDRINIIGPNEIITAKKDGKQHIYNSNGRLIFQDITEKVDIKKLGESNVFEFHFTESNKYIYINPFTENPMIEVLNKKAYSVVTAQNRIIGIKTDDGLLIIGKDGKKIDIPKALKIDYFKCLTIITLKDREERYFYDYQGNYLGQNSKILRYSHDINSTLIKDDSLSYFLDKSCNVIDSCVNCSLKTFNDTTFFKILDESLEIKDIDNNIVSSYTGNDLFPIRNEFYDKYAYKKVGDNFKFIDNQSNVVEQYTFSKLREFTNDIIYIKTRDSLHFLDMDLQVLSSIEDYEVITFPKQWDKNLFWVSQYQNGRPFAGVLDRSGNVVLDAFTEDLVEISHKCALIAAQKDNINHLFSDKGKLLYKSQKHFKFSCNADTVVIDEDGELFAFLRNEPSNIFPRERKKRVKSKYERPDKKLKDSLNNIYDEVVSIRGISGQFIVQKGDQINVVSGPNTYLDLQVDSIPTTIKFNNRYFGLLIDSEEKEYLVFEKDKGYINKIKGIDLLGYYQGYTQSPKGYLVGKNENGKRFLINLITLKEYRAK